MLRVTKVHPLALCSPRSFLSITNISVHEVRLYQYFFGLRGDADLTAEYFLGNWAAFNTPFLSNFASYKRHLREITFPHSQILGFFKDLREIEQHLNFKQPPTPGTDDDQSMEGMVAMDKGQKLEARDVLISQSSKVFICLVMKIKLIAEHQMTLPSDRRTSNDIGSPSFSSLIPSSLVRFPPEQDCESTIPMSFLFIVSFKTSPLELLCIWSHFRVVMYMKLFCIWCTFPLFNKKSSTFYKFCFSLQ